MLRFGLWLLTRTLYRVRVLGRENIPDKGGALFVCNHVSFVDALLLIASTDRRVRFIMFAGIYDLPWVKPFARILGAIPISSAQRPRDLLQSLRTASEAIRAGDVVCIFAEGQITRIGQLLPFRRGLEQDHEGRGGAHRAGGAGRRVGQHLQFREAAFPVGSGRGEFPIRSR